MHSLEFDDVIFNYNSDLSGDVKIVRKSPYAEFQVSGESLLRFISYWVAVQKISELEDADWDEILGIKRR